MTPGSLANLGTITCSFGTIMKKLLSILRDIAILIVLMVVLGGGCVGCLVLTEDNGDGPHLGTCSIGYGDCSSGYGDYY